MKYSDFKYTFEPPKIWRYTSENLGGNRSYGQIWSEEKKFQKMKTELKEGICKTIEAVIDASETEKDVGSNLDPVFERFHKSYFCSNDINEELLLKKANRNTLAKKLQEWAKQLNQNVDVVKSVPGSKVFYNKFKGVPAVIVCAGPSLKQSINQLKGLKKKAVIIAVDTSFKSLMKRGIEPHFVNAHDANENGKKFFEGQKTEAVGVFVNYIHPRTIKAYDGPMCFYYVDDDSISVYKTMSLACDGPDRRDGSFEPSKIIGGSSVAHTAMYLAMELGCTTITYIGLDLSYPNMERSHFESDNMKSIKEQKLIEVEDIQGRKIKTNLSFMSYKTVFEKMTPILSHMKNLKLFTSSQDENGKPAGIVHAGLEPMRFETFIDLYCQKDREELTKIKEIYNG